MSEQTAPATPDRPAVGWSQIEARAFNAVLPALRSVGEWLPLSARRAVAAAVLAELKPELDRLADYENRITWHTTCGSCARILDSSIRETERAERAEAAAQAALQTLGEDRCIHDRGIHARHHHTPVDGCPWCTTGSPADRTPRLPGVTDVPTAGARL